jgi:hypothetical protein
VQIRALRCIGHILNATKLHLEFGACTGLRAAGLQCCANEERTIIVISIKVLHSHVLG